MLRMLLDDGDGPSLPGQPTLLALCVALVFALSLAGIAAGAPEQAATSIDATTSDELLSDGSINADYGPWPDCERCHSTLETNTNVRELNNEVRNQPNHEFDLEHTEGQWCYDCHSTENMNRLVLLDGMSITWSDRNVTTLCAECHGPVYRDWQENIHGKWTGTMDNTTADKYCTDCHDPHQPAIDQIEPEPTPRTPASGPQAAQYALPGTYYFGVGLGAVVALALLGYATRAIWGDHP